MLTITQAAMAATRVHSSKSWSIKNKSVGLSSGDLPACI